MFRFPVDDFELRLHEEHHAQALFDVVEKNRDHLGQWLPFVDMTRGPDDTLAFIRRARRSWAEGRSIQTGIWRGGQIIGTIGFVNLDRSNDRAEIGYWLDADYQGQGIITRAVRALLDYGFGELDLYRVEIRSDPDNEPSWKIPERLGFVLEGVTRGWARFGDRHVDCRVYSILRDEWSK